MMAGDSKGGVENVKAQQGAKGRGGGECVGFETSKRGCECVE